MQSVGVREKREREMRKREKNEKERGRDNAEEVVKHDRCRLKQRVLSS